MANQASFVNVTAGISQENPAPSATPEVSVVAEVGYDQLPYDVEGVEHGCIVNLNPSDDEREYEIDDDGNVYDLPPGSVLFSALHAAMNSGDLLATFDALDALGCKPLPLEADESGKIKKPMGNGWGKQPVDRRRRDLKALVMNGATARTHGVGVQAYGYVVCDIDTPDKDRSRFDETLAAAVAMFGDIFAGSFEYDTAGGRHIWFKISPELHQAWFDRARGKIAIPLPNGGALEFFTGHDARQFQVAVPPSLGKLPPVADCVPLPIPQAIVEALLAQLQPPAPAQPVNVHQARYQTAVDATNELHWANDILHAGWFDSYVHDNEPWLTVGFALQSKFGADGIRLWDSWSQRSNKYSQGECTRRGNSFDAHAVGGITFGRFVNMAKATPGCPLLPQNDPDHPNRWKNRAKAQPAAIDTPVDGYIPGQGECDWDEPQGAGDDKPYEATPAVELAYGVLKHLVGFFNVEHKIWWQLPRVVGGRFDEPTATAVIAMLQAEMSVTHPEPTRDCKKGTQITWKWLVNEAKERGYTPEAVDAGGGLPEEIAMYALGQMKADGGELVFYQDAFYRHDGTKYVPLTGKHDLSNLLAVMLPPVYLDYKRPYTPAERDTVLMHLRAMASIDDSVTGFKSWIQPVEGDPDPTSVVAVGNGLLILGDTGEPKLVPHSDRWFSITCAEADYNPQAAPPKRYLKLLDELYEGDKDAAALELEMLGATVAGDTRFHKIPVLYGQERAAKGVRMNIYGRLCGGFAPVTVRDIVSDRLQHIIGKSMLVMDEPNVKLMATEAGHEAVSFLKGVSGGSPVSFKVLYGGNFTGVLPAIIWVTSNPMFVGPDSSGTFSNRLVGNIHGVSFLGREDLGLEKELGTELDGILMLAIQGLMRLRRNGQFTRTTGTERMREASRGSGSSTLDWMESCVDVTGDHQNDGLAIDELYESYKRYCAASGCGAVKQNGLKADLLRDARLGYPKNSVWHPGRKKTGRFFTGVRLKPETLCTSPYAVTSRGYSGSVNLNTGIDYAGWNETKERIIDENPDEPAY